MTFESIVEHILKRVNLVNSDEAVERVGEFVNTVYKQVTADIGLNTSRRVTASVTLDPDDVDSTLPLFTVSDMEKVTGISQRTEGVRTLDESTFEELREVETKTAAPGLYAVKRMGANSVTILLDAFPDEEFTLSIDGYELSDELSDNAEPSFPESYHNVLIEGALALELYRMEKASLAAAAEQRYNDRLSALRMFIAKSYYLDPHSARLRRVPWLNRSTTPYI